MTQDELIDIGNTLNMILYKHLLEMDPNGQVFFTVICATNPREGGAAYHLGSNIESKHALTLLRAFLEARGDPENKTKSLLQLAPEDITGNDEPKH